jgi:DNA replication protein DnaC
MKLKTYKLRAECIADLQQAIEKLKPLLKTAKIYFPDSKSFPDCDFEFETELALDEIQMSLLDILDGHVMAQTVALIEGYTGERDYSIELTDEQMDNKMKAIWEESGIDRNPVKHIIIQGKQASGKTHIAEAISMTHSQERVLKTDAKNVRLNIEEGNEFSMLRNIDLIIIDECKMNDIAMTIQLLPRNLPINIVFLTTEKIPEIFQTVFWVINANNNY